ncbi:hypothetical protein [Pedobacter sp.]|jgi:hypothetical protein|uniref:hypothetical protein n=1 Tax=Pedobacter sp. TaxID=1411316 RepID=UPI002CADEE4C|nr:hypothetical protein [Pedobacter sp.]HWW39595.1 hypothetical protein [Pedobacter sp.]
MKNDHSQLNELVNSNKNQNTMLDRQQNELDKVLIYAMIGDVTALLADEYPDFFNGFKLPATPKK